MEYKKNPDGTDFLDENGNKVPIDITDEKDKEAAKVVPQLVDEIKDLRLRLGIAEGLLKGKEETPESKPKEQLTDDEKVKLIVENTLKDKAVSDAKANKTAAFEKFITENKEFSPENDPTGLRREALLKKFNQFNTDNLSKIEEFIAVIGDAKTLLLGSDNQVDTTKDKNPYSNPPRIPNNPPAKKNDELTPKELKLIAQSGTTKERILKLKATNPDYLAQLLEYVRD